MRKKLYLILVLLLIICISAVIFRIKGKNNIDIYQTQELNGQKQQIEIKKDKIDNNTLKERHPVESDEFYLDRFKNRYLAYWEKMNTSLYKTEAERARKCVEVVNSNADKKFYSEARKADSSKGTLVLVNKFYHYEKDYEPNDLVQLRKEEGNGYLRKEAYEAFMQLRKDALNKGYNIWGNSPFRSGKEQESWYLLYVNRDGKEQADTYSARPGYSEHQTGLVVDVSEPGATILQFEKSPGFDWMSKNCQNYGFILRYPKDKIDVTGYKYEPWHYRYVGKEVARYLKSKNITLDEYYEFKFGGN